MKKTDPSTEAMRLNRYLSRCGLGSRRACEGYITAGKISVNGAVVRELSTRVRPGVDEVRLEGKTLKPEAEPLYFLLHKPPGVAVSRDGQGKPTVFDIVRGFPPNLTYCGRLDSDSEGLLLLTTDGDLVFRATHPKFGFRKIYRAETLRPLPENALVRFRRGLSLGDGPTAPAQIDRLAGPPPAYRVVISEGRNRQVRRMFEHLNHPLTRLIRTGFGPLRLGGLKPREFRPLTPRERRNLKLNLKRNPKRGGRTHESRAGFRYSGTDHS